MPYPRGHLMLRLWRDAPATHTQTHTQTEGECHSTVLSVSHAFTRRMLRVRGITEHHSCTNIGNVEMPRPKTGIVATLDDGETNSGFFLYMFVVLRLF